MQDQGSSGAAESSSGVDENTSGATPPAVSTSGVESTTGDDTSDASTTGGDESTESSSGAGSSSTGTPFEADCEARCANVVDGSCVGLDGDCAATCEDVVQGQTEAVADAFEVCVSEDPLCFSFIEDCMWAGLFGDEEIEQQYVLEATGFDVWNGRTVYSRLLAGDQTVDGTSGTIAGGEFSVDFTVVAAFDGFSNARNFYLFVDVDDDGECTPGVDHLQSVWMQSLGSDFSAPSFVVETTPSEVSNDNLCSQF